MKLWTTAGLFPDPARNFYAAENQEGIEFGQFIPDAEGYPYIFNDHCMAQADHHKKYINKYSLKWWVDCMESARNNALHR